MNIPFDLKVRYDDIFTNHHTTTFCATIITGRGHGIPRQDASGAVECDNYQFIMN
jgi:hypothetical protein